MEAKSTGSTRSESKYSANDSDYKQSKGTAPSYKRSSKQEDEADEDAAVEAEWNDALNSPQEGEIKVAAGLEARKIVEGFKM